MLAHQQAHRRQLLHLPPLVPDDRRRLVQGRLTGAASGGPVLDEFVRRRHQVQRLAAVAQLPARLLATPTPLAARALARHWVARRRFAAVVAVFGEACPQLLVLRQQLLHLRPQSGHLGDLRSQGGILGFQCGDAFLCSQHVTMLHLQRKPGWTDPIRALTPISVVSTIFSVAS
jgi:hypothetical protein